MIKLPKVQYLHTAPGKGGRGRVGYLPIFFWGGRGGPVKIMEILFAIQSLYEAKLQNYTFGRLVYTAVRLGTHPLIPPSLSYLRDITTMRNVSVASHLFSADHVTYDAHFRTWLSYSSQKSCVKIWFGLVKPFKSYCGNQQKKK